MNTSDEMYKAGLLLHGHKCPAMPMGLRVGKAALTALGVERAKDGQLMALVELGDNHCATCFADGVQMATGCTFGKGNIQKLHYGKWGVTLIDKKTQKAVRVFPKAEAMMANKKSVFFTEYREKGVPASQVPAEVVEPMVERVLGMPDDQLMNISDVFAYTWQDKPHTFSSFVCESCGEMTVECYGRIFGEKKVCISCQQRMMGL
ncbi:putative Tungsten formylmethanofuran dehydrogenase, subunit E [uncultured Desulfobacterium sp.]|uniref:Putative Tungsten formylmethanofuran dehydrogenase, subunit E n=1 Tax=uncultured Desulfobacterium sp. TaxID=201089 RepID=A0A445N3P6_9BACT|nr:putative Tungsten formylmethanofuran dehydrogenase, subunit E [uncultured Desulfobacterium sp.]